MQKKSELSCRSIRYDQDSKLITFTDTDDVVEMPTALARVMDAEFVVECPHVCCGQDHHHDLDGGTGARRCGNASADYYVYLPTEPLRWLGE